MGGGDGGNSEVIAHQKKQAKKAELKAKEDQNLLQSGRDRIMSMFSEGGGTYMTPEKYGNITKTRQVPIYAQSNRTPGYNPGVMAGSEGYQNQNNGGGYQPGYMGYGAQYGMDQNGGNQSYGGNQGKITGYKTEEYKEKGWKPGEEREVSGIGQDFYDNFTKSINDYYTPQIDDQALKAREANRYDLARRGMLRSSVAADHSAELLKEEADARARMAADAQSQTAGLRGDIANAQQSAISLLQQTHDPNAAANAAATEVNAIQSQSPNFNPLGDLFSAAARSFAGFQQQQNKQRAYQQALSGSNPFGSGSGRNIG